MVELAALFTAVAVADGIANLVAHGPSGPGLLMVSAAVLAATAAFHTWWARRHPHAPPAGDSGAPPPVPLTEGPADEWSDETALWRMRTTVADEPGSLAALCTALARARVDILSLQTHPLAEGTVDEFLLRAPRGFSGADLATAAAHAGGRDTWTERADAHDLVDAPARILQLATRTALDSAELPLALRSLLGRCTIRSRPAGGGDCGQEGALEGTVLRLRAPEGGEITVERPHLPFTPTEFARARALVGLDARLGPRVPRGQDLYRLPEGAALTVRRADHADHEAARALHDRCTARTLGLRYHGPVRDADRYLDHLLSPRFGRTLAVFTPAGRAIALGHLLWDGEETEVALLVEDEWQGRGVGTDLLARLVAMAVETGSAGVYAVTQASNTAMVAAMRGLGLPLDYQIEEGTLVITARLGTDGAADAHAVSAPVNAPADAPIDAPVDAATGRSEA
ncbi:GNAT family N-acetyltransferase [Streptomyces tsukubensis]|nr:GNAT family N-acetyltransferase [Streptomyces tsukubensis]